MIDHSDHIADRAEFLAALSRDDPERKAADEHARSCMPCREALEEGVRFIGLLRQALPVPSSITDPAHARAAPTRSLR